MSKTNHFLPRLDFPKFGTLQSKTAKTDVTNAVEGMQGGKGWMSKLYSSLPPSP